MRSIGLFFIGALAGAAVFALTTSVMQRPQPAPVAAVGGAQPELGVQHAAPPKDDTSIAQLQAPEQQGQKPRDQGATEPGATLDAFEPDTDAEWNALVGGMLEWEVERRTGQHLSAEQRDRLVAELGRLREASLELQEAPVEPDGPAELRERLTRMLALAQADRTFRSELGIGVAEFLQGLDPHAVEEVSPVQPEQ